MIVFHDAVSEEQLEDKEELAELQVRRRRREGGREEGRRGLERMRYGSECIDPFQRLNLFPCRCG